MDGATSPAHPRLSSSDGVLGVTTVSVYIMVPILVQGDRSCTVVESAGGRSGCRMRSPRTYPYETRRNGIYNESTEDEIEEI